MLGDEAPEEWRREVGQVFFRGRPYENEVVFFHRASRTLLLCDLAFNFGPRTATPTRLLMKLLRSYGRFGPSKLDPLLIRDRDAAAGVSSAFSTGISIASWSRTARFWRGEGAKLCGADIPGCSAAMRVETAGRGRIAEQTAVWERRP